MTKTYQDAATNTLAVEKRSNLSQEEFVCRYRDASQPVVIVDAAAHWSAYTKWTPSYLKEQLTYRAVAIDGKNYKFSELIDLVMESSEQKPAPYLRGTAISVYFPELMPDIQPYPQYVFPNRLLSKALNQVLPKMSGLEAGFPELLIGGLGSRFPVLHFDNWHVHAFITQIYGGKEFTIFPPEQGKYLYPREQVQSQSSISDVDNPDLERYPLFAKATPIKVIVNQGETIFVPKGWWHTTKLLGPSIAVSLNSVDKSNWNLFIKDVAQHPHPWKAQVALMYYRTLGGLYTFLGK